MFMYFFLFVSQPPPLTLLYTACMLVVNSLVVAALPISSHPWASASGRQHERPQWECCSLVWASRCCPLNSLNLFMVTHGKTQGNTHALCYKCTLSCFLCVYVCVWRCSQVQGVFFWVSENCHRRLYLCRLETKSLRCHTFMQLRVAETVTRKRPQAGRLLSTNRDSFSVFWEDRWRALFV